MFCRFCGTENRDGENYCKRCGKPLNFEAPTAAPAPEAGAAPPSQPFQNSPTVDSIITQRQVKKAYFWYKVSGFFGAVALSGLVISLLSAGAFGTRLLWGIGFLIVFGGLAYAALLHHNSIAGLPQNTSDEDVEKRDKMYAQMFGNKTRGIWIAAGIIGVIVLLLNLSNGFGFALKLGVVCCLASLTVFTAVWAFKAFGVLGVIAAVILVVVAAINEVGLGNLIRDGMQSSQTTAQASSSSCAEILGAYLSEYNEKQIIVVSYSWTNTTGETGSALYEISAHAYQNGVELDSAIFASVDNSMASKDIRPGVTVEMEKAFYLRDYSDVEVEINPMFSFENEVYAYEVFSFSD